jgi:hypothetical protein
VHDGADLVREGVSEGWTGLPVRLALRWSTRLQPARRRASRSGTASRRQLLRTDPNNAFCLVDQSYASMSFARRTTTSSSGVVY